MKTRLEESMLNEPLVCSVSPLRPSTLSVTWCKIGTLHGAKFQPDTTRKHLETERYSSKFPKPSFQVPGILAYSFIMDMVLEEKACITERERDTRR